MPRSAGASRSPGINITATRLTGCNMQQVKIFKSVDNELGEMEQQINNWIAESKSKILSIHGNISPQAGKHGLQDSFSAADVLIIVLYEV
jgi:hypothetical protein